MSIIVIKKSIFQTFWKPHCCAKFFVYLFRDLKFWLSRYLLILKFSLTLQSFSKIGQTRYLTFYKGPHNMVFQKVWKILLVLLNQYFQFSSGQKLRKSYWSHLWKTLMIHLQVDHWSNRTLGFSNQQVKNWKDLFWRNLQTFLSGRASHYQSSWATFQLHRSEASVNPIFEAKYFETNFEYNFETHVSKLYLVQLIRTTNTNPEFFQRIFVYLLLQFLRCCKVFIFSITSFFGFFWCILILIENF